MIKTSAFKKIKNDLFEFIVVSDGRTGKEWVNSLLDRNIEPYGLNANKYFEEEFISSNGKTTVFRVYTGDRFSEDRPLNNENIFYSIDLETEMLLREFIFNNKDNKIIRNINLILFMRNGEFVEYISGGPLDLYFR